MRQVYEMNPPTGPWMAAALMSCLVEDARFLHAGALRLRRVTVDVPIPMAAQAGEWLRGPLRSLNLEGTAWEVRAAGRATVRLQFDFGR